MQRKKDHLFGISIDDDIGINGMGENKSVLFKRVIKEEKRFAKKFYKIEFFKKIEIVVVTNISINEGVHVEE